MKWSGNFSKFVRLRKNTIRVYVVTHRFLLRSNLWKNGEEIRVIWTVRNLPNSYSSLCTYFTLFSFRISDQLYLLFSNISGLTNWYFWRSVLPRSNSELKMSLCTLPTQSRDTDILVVRAFRTMLRQSRDRLKYTPVQWNSPGRSFCTLPRKSEVKWYTCAMKQSE